MTVLCTIKTIFTAAMAVTALSACASSRAPGDPKLGFSVTLDWQTNCDLRTACDPHSNICFSRADTDAMVARCEQQRKDRVSCIEKARSYEEAYDCEAKRIARIKLRP